MFRPTNWTGNNEVDEMTGVRQDAPVMTLPTYVHLLRAARRLFQPDELERLVPRTRGGPRLADVNGQGAAALDPIAATEAIAYDFLAKGGKYARPFITLAAYDALTGGHCTQAEGDEETSRRLTSSVCRAAVSIEAFHKASLVHDDIQDGDAFRYGEPTLHMEHGIPTAINVGDFLIGLGYHVVSRDIAELGAEVAADILNKLAEAHTKLSEGQGAELVWRDGRDKQLTPAEALRIYALKTAPAFEAALYCGLRLAGPADHYASDVREFATHLGIAFQVLNDLQDWRGDDFNKLCLGGDVLGGRPTVLWALALQGLDVTDRGQMERLVADAHATPEAFAEIRSLYQKAGAFDQSMRMVDSERRAAVLIAESFEPDALRRLALYLIASVLEPANSTSSPPRRPLAVPSR